MVAEDAPQTLQDRFSGVWMLRRDIYDLDSEWIGRFTGHATLDRDNDALAYFEQGKLKFGGLNSITATRAYRWTFPGAGRVAVAFEDGRRFHEFDANLTRAKASHYCDPDTYEVAYVFANWPEWRAEWRVEGPRKNYRMVSIYTRN